jgi:hypothetical protein
MMRWTCDLVHPFQHEVRDPRTDEEDQRIDDQDQDEGEADVERAHCDEGGDHNACHHRGEQRERDEGCEVKFGHIQTIRELKNAGQTCLSAVHDGDEPSLPRNRKRRRIFIQRRLNSIGLVKPRLS